MRRLEVGPWVKDDESLPIQDKSPEGLVLVDLTSSKLPISS